MVKPRLLAYAVLLYVGGLVAIHFSIPPGIAHRTLETLDANGLGCPGTLWQPASSKGVVLIGHGVTCNQGVMAILAKTFAGSGFTAITFDFEGHGRSARAFRTTSNLFTVEAWYQWASSHYPELPIVYLGHSMGALSGAAALGQRPLAGFIALGALPHGLPARSCLAAGVFEETFSFRDMKKADDTAEVLISPLSNHMLEPWDPLLISDMVSWAQKRVGLPPHPSTAYLYWALSILGVTLLSAGALLLAALAVALISRCPWKGGDWGAPDCPHSILETLSPYRRLGRFFSWGSGPVLPRSFSPVMAIGVGLVFGAVFIGLVLSFIDTHIFTSSVSVPQRAFVWVILTLLLLPVFLREKLLLELLHHANMR